MPRLPDGVQRRARTVIGVTGHLQPAYVAQVPVPCSVCGRLIHARAEVERPWTRARHAGRGARAAVCHLRALHAAHRR
jgi:hypothetical protein